MQYILIYQKTFQGQQKVISVWTTIR